MSMFEAAIAAAERLFTTGPILGMLAVLPIALISGLMPGGGLPITAVVLGFVGFLDPWVAITIVVFQSAANDASEPLPSILMGIPSSRASQATILDGYPMTRQGLAGVAIGASYTASLIGGLVGAAALLFSLPVMRELLFLFGSAEFFLLSLSGMMTVAIVSSGAFVKGMLTAMLGVAIAMIGYSPIGGVVRADFGIHYLWDGIPLVPLVVGIFAIPEAIDLVVGNTPIAMQRLDEMLKGMGKDVYRGMKIALNHKWLIVRSSLIGVFVGALPGVGGSVAHWISYAQARATEKGAKGTFGKGDVRGVIAAESSNNAVDGGDLIPTVGFGIPGSGGMALLLAMFILYGIQPGPEMLTTNLDLTISFVYVIALANVVVVPIMLLASPIIARVAAIPPNLIAPVTIGVVTLSAFMATFALGDLMVALGFAALGIFMKRYGWPRPPILIAAVLSQTLEQFMYSSVSAYGASMLARPQFLAIAAFMLLIIVGSLRMQRGVRRLVASMPLGAATGESAGAVEEQRSASKTAFLRQQLTVEIVGEMILLLAVAGFFLYLFIPSRDWPWGARLVPQLAVIIGTPFLIIRIIYVLRILFWSRAVGVVTPSQIMDMGFRVGDDPKGEGKRWIRILSAIGVLYLGIWLVGFHVALPLWVFVYMVWFGKANYFLAGGIALAFLGLIVGVYGHLIRVPWHDPPLFHALQVLL
ncbi:MAG: tripartite tricarboxylate transporter permease [Candidatus Binatia bacterium]